MNNRKYNATNPYQGGVKKVLCVCSAGLLRSPSVALFLSHDYEYNTRAVGVDREFALIPLDEVLVEWADEIVFVEQEIFNKAEKLGYLSKIEDRVVKVLDIPDNFMFGDPILMKIIRDQYDSYGV